MTSLIKVLLKVEIFDDADNKFYLVITSHVCFVRVLFSTPAPGFFNNDSVPDFMITFQEGPGFPVYYKAMVRVWNTGNRNV